MNLVKKTALLLFTSAIVVSGSAYAAEGSVDSQSTVVNISNPFITKDALIVSPKVVDVVESSIVYREAAPSSDQLIRVEKVADLEGIDKETGKILDERALKASLEKLYNSDNSKINGSSAASIFNNIAEIQTTKASNNIISPMYADGQIVMESWTSGPYLASQDYMVRYQPSWISEDNYRSAVPIKVTYTKMQKVALTINFAGSDEIRKKYGFTVGGSVEQTTTIAQGADIPAWTVWGTRPYIKYRNDNYTGEYTVTIYASGSLNNYTYTKTGTNTSVVTKANEYWSRENTSKSINATTPIPPTTAPNV
ncbi:hypothetical protein [Paenibacillus sp. FSL R7-0331]|uniref:hypothetical protein n=1 Tax=Paenibacillus sp. FSL R7-0331 TaxID=1536773 RepID=UPI0004F76922|nr:hypothetical protein [Paenibacillus sp. FSL R7-0331]AIQ50696.1 hypothetical protein R70331_03510 [Paenibacillus sp. FSL R7-0331]